MSIIFFMLQSCDDYNNYNTDERIEKWYTRLKEEINLNAQRQVDSVDYKIQNKTLYVTYFNNENKLYQEYRSLDTSRIFVITKYGENNLFELRSEVYENGVLATEGLVFNDNYYGPWTIRYENEQIMYRGYRYENKDFGDWIYYSIDGKKDSLVNKGKQFLADSILNKKGLHTTKNKLH